MRRFKKMLSKNYQMNLKKNQVEYLEMKNRIIKIKNSMDGHIKHS